MAKQTLIIWRLIRRLGSSHAANKHLPARTRARQRAIKKKGLGMFGVANTASEMKINIIEKTRENRRRERNGGRRSSGDVIKPCAHRGRVAR